MQSRDHVCPITGQEFIFPVLASDGTYYEFCALVQWLRGHQNSSPVTRQPILSITRVPSDGDYSMLAQDIGQSYQQLRFCFPEIQIHGVYDLRLIKEQADQYAASFYATVGLTPAAMSPEVTLFFIAAYQGNLKAMQALQAMGMDINRRHFDTGVTALHVAAEQGHTAIVAWLLQQEKCEINFSRLDNAGLPLDAAAGSGQAEAVQCLLSDVRVDPNHRRINGVSALDCATGKHYHQCMYYLLSHPATHIGRALHFARKGANPETVNMVLNCYLSRMMFATDHVYWEFSQWPKESIGLLCEYKDELWRKIQRIEGFKLPDEFYDVAGEKKSLNKSHYADFLENIFTAGGMHPLKDILLGAPEPSVVSSVLVEQSIYSSPGSITAQLTSPAGRTMPVSEKSIQGFIEVLRADLPMVGLGSMF